MEELFMKNMGQDIPFVQMNGIMLKPLFCVDILDMQRVMLPPFRGTRLIIAQLMLFTVTEPKQCPSIVMQIATIQQTGNVNIWMMLV